MALTCSARATNGHDTPPNGQTQFEEQRLAGNTLLWDRGDGVLLRLEGELDRDEAIRIARSVG